MATVFVVAEDSSDREVEVGQKTEFTSERINGRITITDIKWWQPGGHGCSRRFQKASAMMQNGIDGMWGMGLWGLVGLVVVALVIAALVKYVFFR